jgi:hypothetical protein
MKVSKSTLGDQDGGGLEGCSLRMSKMVWVSRKQ